MTLALWQAMSTNSILLPAPLGKWTYTSSQACPARNHDCYFLPTTNVSSYRLGTRAAEILATKPTEMLPSFSAELETLGIDLFTRRSLDEIRSAYNFGLLWKDKAMFPRKTGCWIAAQLLYFLLQPNYYLEERLRAEKQRLNWGQGPTIALHVRHGWRARFNGDISLKNFLMAARDFNASNVLLITEDQTVINEAENLFPEYNWMYTLYPRNNPHDIGVEMERGGIDPTAEAINALVNLLLASEAQYFVGRTNSTWFRLMIMLAAGKYGVFPEFRNVGNDWGHGGLAKWGFFGLCTMGELEKELQYNPRTAFTRGF